MDPAPFSLGLTPHGRLILTHDPDASHLDALLQDRLRQAFERGSGHGLLLLGAARRSALMRCWSERVRALRRLQTRNWSASRSERRPCWARNI